MEAASDPTIIVDIITALTPLLTGPTAGLATVLLLLGGVGLLTYWGLLPILRSSWERQNKALESVTSAMQGVQAAMEALTDETKQRLTAIEADVEKVQSDVSLLKIMGGRPMSPDRLT